MKLVLKHNFLPRATDHTVMSPRVIILHDTAGPTLRSAEETLKQRGLGYHYMIDRDGTCYEYAPPTVKMNHAVGYNGISVGISYVGGGGYGPVNDIQIQASIDLINKYIKPFTPTIRQITGHRHASNSGKIDPEWEGDSANTDADKMQSISKATMLRFVKFT